MNASRTMSEADERLVDSDKELADLYRSLNGVDGDILSAIGRRMELTRLLELAERAGGAAAYQLKRDVAVINKFGVLGKEGHALGRLLVKLSRRR